MDLAVVDDLDVVAPGIVEVRRSRGLHFDARLDHRRANGLLVIDD